MKAVHVYVTGRVQGVWYRASTQREAQHKGLAGWVRNRRDGRVEAWFEGDAAAVDALVRWCHEGPELARVFDVEVAAVEPEGFRDFEVRATV
ncbi:MAG: acylphosphatase [Alphaproteobacteria bacterium]|nr:acylphosphatase [Alphaproteobacteria bacterium]